MSSLRDRFFFKIFTILDQNQKVGWHGTRKFQIGTAHPWRCHLFILYIGRDAVSEVCQHLHMPSSFFLGSSSQKRKFGFPTSTQLLLSTVRVCMNFKRSQWLLFEFQLCLLWLGTSFLRGYLVSYWCLATGGDQTPWKPWNSYVSGTTHLHLSFWTVWQIGKGCESFNSCVQPWASFLHASPWRLGVPSTSPCSCPLSCLVPALPTNHGWGHPVFPSR